jgi:ketosteroid isomerase-like protein
MSLKYKIGITLLGTFLFAFGTVQAQDPEGGEAAAEAEAVVEDAPVGGADTQQAADDYVAVWSVIEEQWEASQRGDRRWVEQLLSADFKGWPKNSPAPRDKASTRMWNDFGSKQSKGLAHELYPLSTVFHGDMAVAHYLYTNATENKDGETKVANGRYTDVLVRIDGEWKFITWHGGDDEADD